MADTPYCEVVDIPIGQVSVPRYTDEEHGTWALLIETQDKLIEGRACRPFIEGYHRLGLPKNRIPSLKEISDRIESFTGWKLLRVEGLVHPRVFFELLARKVFPSTDFIRKRSELMYTPAPDMFHDLFGHCPLITDPDFCEFFEAVGRVGAKASEKFGEVHPFHDMLQRMYWFTIEFGVTNTPQGVRAYGSGSCSSPDELKFCVSDKCRKHPFDTSAIENRLFDIWKLQEDVFVIDSFPQLGREFRDWAARHGIEAPKAGAR